MAQFTNPDNSPLVRIGLAELTRKAFNGERMDRLASQLLIESTRSADNASALMDLGAVEQLRGNTEAGLDFQRAALKQHRVFTDKIKEKACLRLLVLCAPLEIGNNTPIEFLLQQSDIQIIQYYMDGQNAFLDGMPEHDLIFVAAPGDDEGTNRYIQIIDDFVVERGSQVINCPKRIMRLDRDMLPDLLFGITGLVVPKIIRISKRELIDGYTNSEQRNLYDQLLANRFVIRPTASHAGKGLELLQRKEDLPAYISHNPADEYFVSEFVDYRSGDGDFRKYRIIFIGGKAYPYHMAIGSSWKLWYMNADMGSSPAKLVEEAEFLNQFDQGFYKRHASALERLGEAVGLEYFGIDCAEDRAGNLVVFEADNALIVHDMDAKGKFSYKHRACEKLFNAFKAMLMNAFEKNSNVEIPGESNRKADLPKFVQ